MFLYKNDINCEGSKAKNMHLCIITGVGVTSIKWCQPGKEGGLSHFPASE